jgi:hypothetical protein
MTVTNLKTNYDQAINLSTYSLGTGLSATHYCVEASSGNQTAAKNGPSSQIVVGGVCT